MQHSTIQCNTIPKRASLAGAATSIIFVATNVLFTRLLWQNRSFVVTKVCLLWHVTKHVFCCDKSMLVVTNIFFKLAPVSSWSHPPLTNSIIFDWILHKPKVPNTGIYHPSLTNSTILDWILQKPKVPNIGIYHPSVTNSTVLDWILILNDHFL